MKDAEPERYGEEECAVAFRKLFPLGFASPEVIAEIAPKGWTNSSLMAIFHPSLEQVFQEAIEFHKNLERLNRSAKIERQPPPTLDEVRERFTQTPVDLFREPAELVGRCLWDIFSDNHEVRGPDDRVLDIGSFRSAGSFIADELNRQIGEFRYDYMDFYMGTSWIVCRADVTVVYQMIFKRLRGLQFDWVYEFPKLNLVELKPLRDSLGENNQPEWTDYSPESALAQEQEEQERRRSLAEMKEKMTDEHSRILDEARSGPPPGTVMAYQMVYKKFPRGWPP